MLFDRSSTWAWTWNRFMIAPVVMSGRSAAGGRRGDPACLALAAVFGEIGDQAVHPLERGAVDEVAAVALLRDETGVHQLLQVERERRRAQFEGLRHGSRCHAGGAHDHERAKGPQADRMPQCQEGSDGVLFFHDSSLLEV